MFKKVFILLIFSLCLLHANTINVAVAANVSYAIDDLKKEFNKIYPKTDVKIILGSSGKLTAQIKYGAPYHIFMSADMKYPQSLYNDKVAITKPIVYAQGSLAIFGSKQHDFKDGINILSSKDIKKIAITNPKTAPYGRTAIESIKNSNLYDKIKHKFVFTESVSQAVSYSTTVTDLGFIAKSSLYSPKMTQYKQNINWIDVDTKLYTPINQGIVILKNGQHNKDVENFYNFILSNKSKSILKEFGYLVP
jgi:molybdate transport system substrate-binding protein